MGFKYDFKDTQNLIKRLQRAGKNVPGAIERGMQRGLVHTEREAKLNLTGKVLKVRTGRLRAGVFTFVVRKGTKVIGFLANRVRYARIHEFGGEIKPKNASFLAIPLRKGLPASPRSMEGLFSFRSKKGNLFLARQSGKGKLELLWLLRKKVTIPQRAPLRRAVAKTLRKVIGEIKTSLIKSLKGE